MFARTWLDSLKSRLSRPPTRTAANRRKFARRLLLENLEARDLLALVAGDNYPIGDQPEAVLTADINGDGRLDVVTANRGTSDVSVLLGNADGTFQPAQNSATGAGPHSMAVGDFNNDGKLDLVTANGADVSVLLGDGNGGFQAPVNISLPTGPLSVAVGDFNNDGKLDLGVTSNYQVTNPGYGYYFGATYNVGRVDVLLGTGGGAFAAPIPSPVGSFIDSAVLADFDGDGNLDLATAKHDEIDYVGSGRWVGSGFLLLGTGNGAFHGATTFGDPVVGARWAMNAGDVNGDGIVDLVRANLSAGNVGVLAGVGDGSFGPEQFYAAGVGPSTIALGDVNGDGAVDLLTSGNGIGVLLGVGDGAFRPGVLAAAATEANRLAVGQFNADGLTDVVWANASSSNVSVLLNDGNWLPLDAPSLSINDVTVTEGNTGTVVAEFTVTLSAAFSQPVTVHYATADGSAKAGSDYQAASGTLTFAPGDPLTQTVSVLVNGDRLGEANEGFSVRLKQSDQRFSRRCVRRGHDRRRRAEGEYRGLFCGRREFGGHALRLCRDAFDGLRRACDGGLCDGRPHSRRSEFLSHPRRNGRRRLHGDHGHADHSRGRDERNDHRAGLRRPRRRRVQPLRRPGARDVLRQSQQSEWCAAQHQSGVRLDRRRRAVCQHWRQHGLGGECGHDAHQLHRFALRRFRRRCDGELRNSRRHRFGRQRLPGGCGGGDHSRRPVEPDRDGAGQRRRPERGGRVLPRQPHRRLRFAAETSTGYATIRNDNAPPAISIGDASVSRGTAARN